MERHHSILTGVCVLAFAGMIGAASGCVAHLQGETTERLRVCVERGGTFIDGTPVICVPGD